MKTGYGYFGNLSFQYAQARQEFPVDVIDCLWSKLNVVHPLILDVGCGTGIPTRQMAAREATLIGSDSDPAMIVRAQSQESPNISYVTATTENLPFSEDHFDVVTAFSAFHWCANNNALNEIKRVLKNGGVLFIANKNDTGDFKQEYREVLKQFIDTELPDAKKDYDPHKLLEGARFHEVETRSFPALERFTFDQAVSYLQSVSLWNLVPEQKKGEAADLIVDFCKARVASDGFVHRELKIFTVFGRK